MASSNHSDRYQQIFTFAAILIAALALRLVLFTGMIRSDDFQYAHAAFELSSGHTNLGNWAGKIRIGFFGPVALLYSLFGANNTTTLLWPLFCSLLSIVFIYGIGCLLWNESAGLLGALTWTFLPFDIFLATDLLPDGPQSAFNAGVIFFLLLGEKSNNKKRIIYYIISFMMMIWAILVKEPSLIVFFFVICYVFYRIIDRYQEPLKKTLFVKKILAHPTATTVVGFFIICVSFTLYAAHQPYLKQFIIFLANTASNLAILMAEHIAYWHLSVLFLVSFISILLSQNNKSKIFILFWFGFLYLYYEWGTISTDPFRYSPIDSYMDARYALFIFTPICVCTGRYLSRNFTDRTSRIAALIVSLFMIFISLSYWMYPYFISGTVQKISAASINFFIILCIASPIIFHTNIRSIFKKSFLMVLLCLFSLSTFKVTNDLLALYDDLRFSAENIQKISQYLVTQPRAPVYVLNRQNALALNYFSDFELGYNDFGKNREDQMIDIIDASEIDDIQNGYLVIDTSEIHSSIASGWTQKKEFQYILEEDEKVFTGSQMLYIY